MAFKRDRLTAVIVAGILGYYILVGLGRVALPRHILPLVPLLAVLAGKLLYDACSLRSRWAWTVRGVAALALVYTLVLALSGALLFLFDSRYLAQRWILEHLPQGVTIGHASYGSIIPSGYRIVYEPLRYARPARARLAENTLYHRLEELRSGLFHLLYTGTWPLTLEGSSDVDGSSLFMLERVGPPWHQRLTPTAFDVASLILIEKLKPDVFIANEFAYSRFLTEAARPLNPDQYEFYTHLLANNTPYQLVAEFGGSNCGPLPLCPKLEFVNPRIGIYLREGARTREPRTEL